MRSIATIAVAGIALLAGHSQLSAQQIYKTPEDAATDLVDSARAKTPDFATRILGPQGAALVRSGDQEQDARNLADFNEAAAESVAVDEQDADTRTLRVGDRGWTFPLPIVKRNGGWRFDPERGRTEITNRLIGYDELSAIGACRAYVKAQDEYFAMDREDDGIREYAGKIISSPGARDGLYWEPENQADISPLEDFVTVARQKRKNAVGAGSYNGYYFRILTAQGPSAPGGAHPYRINGSMIAGHAMVAWPVEWGKTGVKSFICGQNGKVFEKNLGPRTGEAAGKMTSYNPDPSWSLVD
jgi:hypothetical protein